jgi:hypothetical protein
VHCAEHHSVLDDIQLTCLGALYKGIGEKQTLGLVHAEMHGKDLISAFLSSAMLLNRFTTVGSTPAGRNASITTRIRHEYARH